VTNAYELFLVIGDKALKANQTYTKNIITTSVNSNMPKNHHAVMKMEVAEWFIKSFTREGDIIIDPFMGIGTTAIVCRENNRHFVGFELSKEYYDMAIENMKGKDNG
jgi:DNA modification methylase